MKMSSALLKMQSQWAAQFLTAGELVRRGHLASFTVGNTPGIDLLCVSPSGKQFSAQCKGGIKPAKFFILTGAQALKEWTKREKYHEELIRSRGPRKLWPCIMLKDAKRYENCWGALPK